MDSYGVSTDAPEEGLDVRNSYVKVVSSSKSLVIYVVTTTITTPEPGPRRRE